MKNRIGIPAFLLLLKATLALVVALPLTYAQSALPAATPIPTVTGPLPVTASSYPFMAANRTLGAPDLSKLGYVEEEYIVSGNANVYDWQADGSLKVLASDGI